MRLWLSWTRLWLGPLPSSWTPGSTVWHFKHRTAGVNTSKTFLDLESLKFPQGKSCHRKWQENLYRVLNMGYTPRKKKQKHANTTMTGSPCTEWSPLCSNGTGRNQGAQVCNGEKLDWCVKTENQILFHCCDFSNAAKIRLTC